MRSAKTFLALPAVAFANRSLSKFRCQNTALSEQAKIAIYETALAEREAAAHTERIRSLSDNAFSLEWDALAAVPDSGNGHVSSMGQKRTSRFQATHGELDVIDFKADPIGLSDLAFQKAWRELRKQRSK